jgi:hypothetical protein
VTTTDDVKHRVERAVHSKWMDRATALGFVARGVVYAVIGGYALALAMGHGGGFLDASDTPQAVKRQPLGDALLLVLAIGLACHALWRFVEAAFASHARDGRAMRICKRIGSVGAGLIAALLSITAFEHVAGRHPDHVSWIQRALRSDGGEWIVIAAGIGFVIAGGHQLYKAVGQTFRKDLETQEMSATERRWLMRISRFGIAARGAVLPVAGWLLIRAGLAANAKQDTGTGAALREISRQTWGTTLLAITAAGLLAYALFMGVNARYRRVFT